MNESNTEKKEQRSQKHTEEEERWNVTETEWLK